MVADSGSSSAADAVPDSADQPAAAGRHRELIGRLSRRRTEAGLSQAHVARLMQTSQSAVARLESGQHDAQLSTVTRYADVLGLSLDFGEDTGTSDRAATESQPEQPAPPHTRARPGREPEGSTPVVLPQTPGNPPADDGLTWRQREVLQVIRESVQQHGLPPTMREIGEAVGLTSTSSVSYQLSVLQQKGYLHRDRGRPRTVEVHVPGPAAAHAAAAELTPEVPTRDVRSRAPVYVPVLGRITGGALTPPGEPADVIPLPRQLVGGGALFVLEMTGDSMINAAITDGDWMVVQAGADARDGDLVVADIDGMPTVRTLKQTEGHLWLLPHHPSYAPTAAEKISIRGRVVSVLRRL